MQGRGTPKGGTSGARVGHARRAFRKKAVRAASWDSDGCYQEKRARKVPPECKKPQTSDNASLLSLFPDAEAPDQRRRRRREAIARDATAPTPRRDCVAPNAVLQPPNPVPNTLLQPRSRDPRPLARTEKQLTQLQLPLSQKTRL